MSAAQMQPAAYKSSVPRACGVIAFVVLVALGVAGRLLPHPPNVTPVLAAALFAGFLFRHRAVAILAPLVTLVISDAVIGLYDWRLMAIVYAAFLAPMLLRPLIRFKPTVLSATGCALAASIVFFVVSNFGVWWLGGLYSKSAAGLVACYVAAIPFFGNSLVGDLVWSGVFFGLYSAAVRCLPVPQLQELVVPNRLIPQPLS